MNFTFLNFTACRTLEPIGNDGSAVYLADDNIFENRCTFTTVFATMGRTPLNGQLCRNVGWERCNIINNTCVCVIWQAFAMCNLTACVIFGNTDSSGSVVGLIAGNDNAYRVSLCAFDFTPTYVRWASDNQWPTITATNTLVHRDPALCRQFYTPTGFFSCSGWNDGQGRTVPFGSSWKLPLSDKPERLHETVPFSGTAPFSGTDSFFGNFQFSETAPFSGTDSFFGNSQFSETAPFSGTVPFSGTKVAFPQTMSDEGSGVIGDENSVQAWVITVVVVGAVLLIVAVFGLAFFFRRSPVQDTSSDSNQLNSALTVDFCSDGGMTGDSVTQSDITFTNSTMDDASMFQGLPTSGRIPVISFALI
jgi:hypothetical protein